MRFQSIQNPEKFTKNVLCGKRKHDEKKRKPTYIDSCQLTDLTYEVTETITKIKEVYPIHVGNTILHLSKLLMAEFITFLEKFLKEQSFRLIYSGEVFSEYFEF